VADVAGLEGAGLEAAVPGAAGRAGDRYLPPGQGFDPGMQIDLQEVERDAGMEPSMEPSA
jgi:hypothetical protein